VALFLLICTAVLAYYGVVKPQRRVGHAGEWLSDDYIGILIPKGTAGTLISEEKYDLTLNLENRTSIPLETTKIVVRKYNEEAGQALGQDGDLVQTSEYNVPEYIEANGRKTLSITGNQILPKKATVEVYHTLSGEPSKFEVDLEAKRMSMPNPRHLPPEIIRRGTDALEPITRARKAAAEWGSTVVLVAAFPGDKKTYIEPVSGLKYPVIEDWVITFYSLSLKKTYTAWVKGDNVDGVGYSPHESDPEPPDQEMEFPQISNQQAVAIADRDGLLCATGQGEPTLRALKINGRWKNAWFVGYLGPDSLPIIVDAQNGNIVRRRRVNGVGEWTEEQASLGH
jgi:hypothetical protein